MQRDSGMRSTGRRLGLVGIVLIGLTIFLLELFNVGTGWLETGGLAAVALVLSEGWPLSTPDCWRWRCGGSAGIGCCWCKPDGARRHLCRAAAPPRRFAALIRDLHARTFDQLTDVP
jgi:hypothetical protein